MKDHFLNPVRPLVVASDTIMFSDWNAICCCAYADANA